MSNQSTKNALAQRRETGNGNGGTTDLRVLVERQKPEIARALTGTALDPERFTRIVLTVIRQSPQLQRCRPESLLGAAMTCAQLGLEPGPLGEAYLVPFKDQVTFIPGYRGLIKLAWNSGQLKTISAHVVHQGDEFDYAYGLEPFLRHKPALGNRGDVIAVYAAATLKDGGAEFIVMSVADVEAIRRRSRASKDGPWATDWEAMACKTAIRQLAKFLPMATTMNRALAADGTVRTSVHDSVDEITSEFVDGEVVEETAEAPVEGPEQPQQPDADEENWQTLLDAEQEAAPGESTA